VAELIVEAVSQYNFRGTLRGLEGLCGVACSWRG